MTDIYNNTSATQQGIYDSYNTLMFSADKRIFNKMAKKIELYATVKEFSGDILEFGVFKGAGIAIFLKLKALYEPNSLMKVIGFDYFNPAILSGNLDGLNKWDESEGVDRFLKEIPGEYEFIDTKISSPTAYLRKISI